MRLLTPILLSAAALPLLAGQTITPTYSRDVAPILQAACVDCHRKGEAAPMPLTTYQQVRPFAAAIKEAVALRKMPPWSADEKYGHFANDRSLTQEQIETLVNWAKAGAPEGDPADLPAPRQFTEGWNIRTPDIVLEMPAAFHVPASGTVEYQYILVPGKFSEDTWVQAAEVRPGNRAVMHHVIAFVRPPGSTWLKSLQVGVPYVPKKDELDMQNAELLAGYAPGLPPFAYGEGRAKLVKAGSDIIFQMHYTPNGKEGTDLTKVGFSLAKGPVTERVLTLSAANGKFAIPPGDPNYRVDSEFEFGADTRIVSLLPHMHLRGKDFEYRAVYPTGESQTLLSVPRYDFNWQNVYYPSSDIVVLKGTKLKCTAHYDNSPNNRNNPDPTKEIHWGDQSWDEMMIGFFDVAFDRNMPVSKLFPPKKETKPAAVAATGSSE